MKMGMNSRIQLGIIIMMPVILIFSSIPNSSALSHLRPMEEVQRLAGTDSDAGNRMVLAQLDAEVVLPNDVVNYFFKRVGESFRETFEFNEEKKIVIKLEHAEERQREIRILEERGFQISQELVDDHAKEVREADEILQRLRVLPSPDPTLRAQIIARIQTSFDQAEISEIRKDFQDLRNEREVLLKMELAEELDAKLNDRTDVRVACFGGVDTLAIANSPRPVQTLRDNCPVLSIFPQEEIEKAMGFGYGS